MFIELIQYVWVQATAVGVFYEMHKSEVDCLPI